MRIEPAAQDDNAARPEVRLQTASETCGRLAAHGLDCAAHHNDSPRGAIFRQRMVAA